MMEGKNEWERCIPNDPNRCQASGLGGQCPYKAKDGIKFCPRHAASADHLAAKAAANQYRLAQYQERMAEFTTSDQLKNLSAEVGILRMTLEGILVHLKTPAEMLAYSGKIGDHVMKITTVVKVCQQMEMKMGLLLSRDKIMMIGQRIVEIVSKILPDPEKLDQIGEEIVGAIFEICDNTSTTAPRDST